MGNNDFFEKAKHNVGDMHPNGKWVWTEFKPGKFDWRPVKKGGASAGGGVSKTPPNANASKPNADNAKSGNVAKKNTSGSRSFSDMTPDEIVNYANEATTSALESAINNKKLDKDVRQIAFNTLKKREDYDKTKVDSSDLVGGYVAKPKPKIVYKNKKPEVEIEIPDSFTIRVPGKNGTLENKKSSTSGLRKLYASKSDEDLLKILNNPNGRWQNRQVAYDEAAARGIPEDKIDVSGKLQNEWNSQKRKADYAKSISDSVNEDEVDSVDIDFKGLDPEEFMKEFPEGDDGWLDKKDPRVRKKFNNFATIKDRQQYDAFKTYYEPTTPGYLNPDNKIGQLNEMYDNFIKYDTTPLFISAGGAGAGKSFGWLSVAEENNLKELKQGEDPNDEDWGWVKLSDPDDEKAFRGLLAKYNGTYRDDDGEEHPRILVFDDSDKILTSKGGMMKALMKKITDNNPENRIFMNPETGENELFKGAILIMTNKDVDSLSASNEDSKAILSRGLVNNIEFTRAENMDLINKRYKTMNLGNYQKAFEKQFPDKKKQQQVRQIVRDWMEENINNADPGRFNPRTFINLMNVIGPILAKGKNTVRVLSNGVQVGAAVPWQAQALKLIKSMNDLDIEKAYGDDDYSEEHLVEQKKKLLKDKKKAKKNNKKRHNALYSKEAVDRYLFGDTSSNGDEQEAEKALQIDLMSRSEAEDILLG